MTLLPRDIKQLLQASGLEWSVEVGSRHLKVRVCGQLAAILPKSPRVRHQEGGNHRGTLAGLKRVIQQHRR